jgi:hypothetical protein
MWVVEKHLSNIIPRNPTRAWGLFEEGLELDLEGQRAQLAQGAEARLEIPFNLEEIPLKLVVWRT